MKAVIDARRPKAMTINPFQDICQALFGGQLLVFDGFGD
jgi:hypothetical protein